jgi:hypothetical protein
VTTRHEPSGEPLRDFLEDWRIHLRARNRSRGTIESYLNVGAALCDWLDREGLDSSHTAITRATLERYLAAMQRARGVGHPGQALPLAARALPLARRRQGARPLADGHDEPADRARAARPRPRPRPRRAGPAAQGLPPATPSRTAATPRSSDSSSTPACARVSWPPEARGHRPRAISRVRHGQGRTRPSLPVRRQDRRRAAPLRPGSGGATRPRATSTRCGSARMAR